MNRLACTRNLLICIIELKANITNLEAKGNKQQSVLLIMDLGYGGGFMFYLRLVVDLKAIGGMVSSCSFITNK